MSCLYVVCVTHIHDEHAGSHVVCAVDACRNTRVMDLFMHLAAVNSAPEHITSNTEALALWVQELLSRAYAMQVVAGNIRGWKLVGRDRQPVPNAVPGTAVKLAEQLMNQGGHEAKRQRHKGVDSKPMPIGKKQKSLPQALPSKAQAAAVAGHAAVDATGTQSARAPSATCQRQGQASMTLAAPKVFTAAAEGTPLACNLQQPTTMHRKKRKHVHKDAVFDNPAKLGAASALEIKAVSRLSSNPKQNSSSRKKKRLQGSLGSPQHVVNGSEARYSLEAQAQAGAVQQVHSGKRKATNLADASKPEANKTTPFRSNIGKGRQTTPTARHHKHQSQLGGSMAMPFTTPQLKERTKAKAGVTGTSHKHRKSL